MRLMAVMAHPDDAEIWCGGALILHAQRGDEVTICILSYIGDSVRGREARDAAKIMGCQVESLGMGDTSIRDTEEAVERLKKSIDLFRPDIILTHWYDDMHPDHESVFLILRRALLKTYLDASMDKEKVPSVLCCDTYNSLGMHNPFLPNRLLNVTDVWKDKLNAIEAHQSQNIDIFVEMIDKQCLEHGKLINTKYAEGFFCFPWFDRPDSGLFIRR